MEALAIAGARDSCPRFVAIGEIEIPRSRKIVSTATKESTGFCHEDGSDLWISQGEAVTPPIHIAFRVSSREAVDAFYKAAMAAGGKDNGPPGLRPHYHPHYYGAFVLDPDGHNIEAVCHEAPHA